MQASTFALKRIITSPTAPDKIFEIERYSHVLSNTRYQFIDSNAVKHGNIAAVLVRSFACVNVDNVRDVYTRAFGDIDIVTDSIPYIVDEMTVSDVLRTLTDTDGMDCKPVKREPQTCNGFSVTVTHEFKKNDKTRGYRCTCAFDDMEPFTLDLVVDRRCNLVPRTYGFAALWNRADKRIALASEDMALRERAETNRFCEVKHRLERLATGSATYGTNYGTDK